MQLIYGGKARQKFPIFIFPKLFSLSANPKDFTLKSLLDGLKKLWFRMLTLNDLNLELEKSHELLILDVFEG